MRCPRYHASIGAALIVSIGLCGCAAAPLAVVPLSRPDPRTGDPPGRPLYSIKDGIRVSNTGAVRPTSWKRATAFCKELGKQPREEQITQQWPAERDFVFSCVPLADPHFR